MIGGLIEAVKVKTQDWQDGSKRNYCCFSKPQHPLNKILISKFEILVHYPYLCDPN
jgi:hypothetical protein